MNKEEKWKAVIQYDSRYDGKFFYGVKTTRIFCHPSCKSKNPNRQNVEFFSTTESAIENGFRPCKRCRPDLVEYNPITNIANSMKEIYDKYYFDEELIQIKIDELHIAKSHLIRVFNKTFGQTPKSYISKVRIEKSKELLKTSNKSITEISYDCGYKSLSTFYDNFKKFEGMSPMSYRIK
ncbi:Ada metal-binding domain-containing protein [Clostridium sp. AL.422]|uniref:bifunctional transcriptional activator/DNA repair enzyme AdaA n=1 Tax=Clostridium TaxID=1485 RepID=UPI00293DFD0D|nr:MULTISPECIES: Ada metal-binding domain-containing protein [unclassified Clostridium]MDV4150510.1 Ada metal-binding domain-containing protein [Clostridium sp. AL.422]